jgi:hypothetical protein
VAYATNIDLRRSQREGQCETPRASFFRSKGLLKYDYTHKAVALALADLTMECTPIVRQPVKQVVTSSGM